MQSGLSVMAPPLQKLSLLIYWIFHDLVSPLPSIAIFQISISLFGWQIEAVILLIDGRNYEAFGSTCHDASPRSHVARARPPGSPTGVRP